MTEIALPWQDTTWLTLAHTWIDDAVDRAGLRRVGEIEQPHVAWWATALRVPTDGGVLWFKAAQPDGAFELPLTRLLANGWPSLTAEIVDGDAASGWLLTRDAGARLRDVDPGPSLERWERLLPQYAEIQRGLAARTDELWAIGVPDHTLAALPGQVDAALADPEVLHPGHPEGLTPEHVGQWRESLARLADDCSRLAAMRVPQTLQHDDLHDGNAFERNGSSVILDWGDACISHPFHTLVVTLRSLAYRHGLEPGGADLLRLRDAYLEPWSAAVPRDEVTEAADLARRTGTVQRAMAWHRVARLMPARIRPDFIDSVPYGLRLYLLDAPWGAWDDGTF